MAKIKHVLPKPEINPLKRQPTKSLVAHVYSTQGNDASSSRSFSLKTAASPFNCSTTVQGFGSSHTRETASLGCISPTQMILLPPPNADHHAEPSPHGGLLPTPISDLLPESSRPLKKLRFDTPSASETNTQSSHYEYYRSQHVKEIPQTFLLSTESTRCNLLNSATRFPRLPSISAVASQFSNKITAGCSSHSSTWSLPPILTDPLDIRRLSVNALLSSPTNMEFANQSKSYGIDKGFLDLDIPRNKDDNALDGITPLSNRGSLSNILENNDPNHVAEFGFGLYGKAVLPSGDEYYASPVPVVIQSILEPLPSVLLDNQMNLLYFHHFINHTARILVPHDCPENPFRIILPQSERPDIQPPSEANPFKWRSAI